MSSDDGHFHWGGAASEHVTYLGQEMEMTTGEPDDPPGMIRIRAVGSVEQGLALPNSSPRSPRWNAVPGTSPVIEVRQDAHYPPSYVLARLADPAV